MERGVVEKAGESEECASSSVVTPNMLTSMPSHSSGSAAASSTFYSACSEFSEAASSVFYSTRIERLSELRTEIDNQLEFDVESSRCHWTEVSAASDGSDDELQVSNRVAFESLKNDPDWGELFRSQRYDKLEIGAKIAEGGQAEIFEAFGRDKYDHGKMTLVLKVFKKGYSLVDLQTLWPRGIASNEDSRYLFCELDLLNFHNLCWPHGVHLLDNGRFAFIFHRFTSDLRKFIDRSMLGSNGRPPFSSHNKLHLIIKSIARGMWHLHMKGILHNDLKAANVMMNEGFGVFEAFVADFESSRGIMGTGFWRAPEILLAVKGRNMKQEICTMQTDVYSFAMTCYEVLTGRMPFEDHDMHDYDIVLRGERPTLPNGPPYSLYNDLVTKCWHQDPCQRPSFEEIIEELIHLTSIPKT